MKVQIILEAEVPEFTRDIRSMEATRQSISSWASENLGTTNISFRLIDDEEDELDEHALNEARYGRLGQG